ncbi:hypothetical protein [Pseudohoeflea coraliihabitans]|uniref:Uncharacterized protein n=1 Tax=Pseudohoeflea coraliihabitans TaxID=2860393 RepID=A0ABS6WNS4_9HYPH|nr:hypothetical protein [Pseudohoeflea sp. DP4N28-3]MBW3097607.1 hypothetical protein [Pseudohoeflea sp. DP4N28-3]
MLKPLIFAGLFTLSAASAAPALDADAVNQSPPGEPFVQVSEALPLPEFIPGLGTLFVDPAQLPAGPFLAYDHAGKLSATVYMTPLKALQDGTAFDGLAVGSSTVSAVDIYYNGGHPGVDEPHAHVVLFHDAEAKARLAE